LFVLCFNLSVLTTWASLVADVTSSLAQELASVPVLGRYAVLYLSATLLQAVFVALARPCLTLALSRLPPMRRSANPRIRVLAHVLSGAAILAGGLCLLLAVLGVVILVFRYRCDVLYNHVLAPFIVITALNMCYAYAVIPLPLLYHLQNAYGSMPSPIGGGQLDHARAEHARIGVRSAGVGLTAVEYLGNDTLEYYREKGLNDQRIQD
jgi:hypothetical protein